tara:strand:+ start:31105 stop:32058 length:954 start_codon:yes stop_codon:yes gene_type:complete
MGFLDNSGDIILDAVLTDTGRFRLAKGDGSFKITKFALGDDEIDYASYDKNNASGSAYYDLNIMQTPVLEAFTNNTSLLKSKLVSMGRNNLLYLPIIKINQMVDSNTTFESTNAFVVCADSTTENIFRNVGNTLVGGALYGQNLDSGNSIILEQGLDTTEIPQSLALDPSLVEEQYIVELDNRFGKIAATTNKTIANPSFIDDDSIASYYLSSNQNADYVRTSGEWKNLAVNNPNSGGNTNEIRGPKGSRLQFLIAAGLDLATSTYLFTQLGSSGYTTSFTGTNLFYFIDTNVRIIGGTTGYTIDLPVRFIKWYAAS